MADFEHLPGLAPESITLSNAQVPAQPLKKIALSCSGGGYRAASFHLGAMSYLNRLQYGDKPLLENVKMISTVSGGTITGAVYALQKQEGKSFEEIYDFMLGNLSKLDLVKMGLDKLNPNGQWDSTHKRKNLINAFAELYNKHFTGGKTLAAFDTMKSHLEAVAFNSTEFNNAINFRFRNKGTGRNGNNFNPVPSEVAGEIRVADAIAASSCFPGGFEPIIWPADFAHEGATNLKQKIKEGSIKPAGLMDGGIYDNQGINSILLFKAREKNYFDLLIISDVTSPFMTAFKPYEDKPKAGWRNTTVNEFAQKIRRFNKRMNWFLFGGVALFGLLPLITRYANTWLTGISIGISFSILLLWIAKMVLIGKAKKGLSQLLSNLEQKIKEKKLDFYYDRLSKLDIGRLSVRRAEPLLMDRLNSLLSLLLDVFLKVVRRLNYAKVYDNEDWQYRRMSNLIRELTEEDFTSPVKQPNKPAEGPVVVTASETPGARTLKGAYQDIVGPEIKKIAEEASNFGTTLWFTDKEQLDDMLGKLVATGQFTMCYNMLDYLEKLLFTPGNGYEKTDRETKEILETMHQKCLEDWNMFKETPLFLLMEMGKRRTQHPALEKHVV